MRKRDLEHILRAASRIVGADMLVIGSQAIHGAFADEELPELTMLSREADVAFWDDPEEILADRLDGAIGELSPFDETHGYYAQGVSTSTAILPSGWEARTIAWTSDDWGPITVRLLDPTDLVLSKLAAFRPKDRDFAEALIAASLLSVESLRERLPSLPVAPLHRRNIDDWLRRLDPSDGAHRDR